MKKDELNEYLRVGIDYYKIVNIPLVIDSISTLKKWNKQTIIDDYGKDSLKHINKYEGFCYIPCHNNFKKDMNGFYNRYEPLSYSFKKKGEWNNINYFLNHIFGNQYEIGLDYLTLLWQKPTQILPVLCLVSDERNTGKTTFLNLLKLLFEGNMTINTNENFRSRFNSDWAGKLLIAVDEVLLDKKEDTERIKNLSTAKHYKVESKGKDREDCEFFGKFILCSNNEDNFIKIDSNEIRFWVIKVKTLSEIKPNLLDCIYQEIPFFANYLNSREIKSKQKTRMWFSFEQIKTKAFEKLVLGNKSTLENELEEMLLDELSFFEVTELCYTAKNLVEMLRQRGVNVSSNYISKVLKNKYNLHPEKNSSYKWYRSNIYTNGTNLSTGFTNEKGRYYRFKIDLLNVEKTH